MSALKAPKHNHQEASTEHGATPGAEGEPGWQFGDLKAHGAGSPARKLQAHLAERLHRVHPVSIRKTLATLAVLCLSMSVAGLYLMATA